MREFGVGRSRPPMKSWSRQSPETEQEFYPVDETTCRYRNLSERMFCRLKDWRRIAARYDKLAIIFAAAVAFAAVINWWT